MNTKTLFLSLALLTPWGTVTMLKAEVLAATATAACAIAKTEQKTDAESAMNCLGKFITGTAAQAPQWAQFVDEFCSLLPQGGVYDGMRKDMLSTRDLARGMWSKKRIYDALMKHKDLIPKPLKEKIRSRGMSLSGYIKLK